LFENAGSLGAICEEHQTNTLLDACLPRSHIGASISPLHDSVPVAFIFEVVATVDVACLPFEDTIAMLLVHEVFSFICVRFVLAEPAIRRDSHVLGVTKPAWLELSPLSMTVLEPILKLSLVDRPIWPSILSCALWLAKDVLADVPIAVCKEVGTAAVSKIALPLALIAVTIAPDMDSVPLSLIVDPLADIWLTLNALPDTVALFDSTVPLTVIYFAIFPRVHAFTMCFAVLVLTLVRVACREQLIASSMPLVVEPLTFIHAATVLVHKYAKPAALLVCVQLAPI
jgi:hypothetical protein